MAFRAVLFSGAFGRNDDGRSARAAGEIGLGGGRVIDATAPRKGRAYTTAIRKAQNVRTPPTMKGRPGKPSALPGPIAQANRLVKVIGPTSPVRPNRICIAP